MTELELYKFLFPNENSTEGSIGCEVSWNFDELTCVLYCWDLKEFASMIKDFLNEDGYEITLKGNYVGFDLVPICEFYDIEPENILKKG